MGSFHDPAFFVIVGVFEKPTKFSLPNFGCLIRRKTQSFNELECHSFNLSECLRSTSHRTCFDGSSLPSVGVVGEISKITLVASVYCGTVGMFPEKIQ